MPSSVESTLQTLLPTTSLIPAQLVSVAGALLAQSKHAAPALKQDEEIARIFTCCHIACERMTNKLALDLGKINPPCAPRVYKKLHSYLDAVLTAGKTAQPGTPRTPRTVDDRVEKTPTSVRSAMTAAITPSKTPILSAKRKREVLTAEDLVPEHIAQLNHHLCRFERLPEAAPHMYAGLEAVHAHLDVEQAQEEISGTPSKRQRKLSAKAEVIQARSGRIQLHEDKVPLVVVALFHGVLEKMRGTEVTSDEAVNIYGETLSFLRDKDDALAERLYRDAYQDEADELSMILARLRKLSFWQTWLDNIAQLSDDSQEIADTEDDATTRMRPNKTPLRRREKHNNANAEVDVPGAAGLLPGLGTMFQPAVDWLSEERRYDYEIWKQEILARIASIEQVA